jgi:hypothetical protein
MAAAPEGNLARFPLEQVLARLATSHLTGRLALNRGDEHGVIDVREGEVVHAADGQRTGDEAFQALIGWRDGSFRFEQGATGSRVTVAPGAIARLQEARREAAERETVRKTIPPDQAVPVLVATAPGGPVTLQPMDWQFITRVDGVRTVAEIARELGIDGIELGRLAFGLLGEGLIDIRLPVSRRADAPPAGRAFFQELDRRAAAALGPIALVVIDDALEALGTTRESLTQPMASSLVELVALEITEDQRRVAFERGMVEVLGGLRAA